MICLHYGSRDRHRRKRACCATLLLFLIWLLPPAAEGQVYTNRYRPPEKWLELRTTHFRILFPQGYETVAYESGRILEKHYPGVQEVTGGSLRRFPVVLNVRNQRSNGFVIPLNFRTEVEVPPMSGKAMNPRTGSWLELVLAHELVHALHMNVRPKSLTSLIGLFSPDLRRSVHSAAPSGFFEGLAVWYETHGISPGGGRGNYPWFTRRFDSGFQLENRWSMGQLVHPSLATRPYDRHYVASYPFIHWIQQEYGPQTMKRVIESHYRLPFLGMGMALRKETGKWPSSLYREFTRWAGSREGSGSLYGERGLQQHSPDQPDAVPVPLTGKRGASLRAPHWIDEERILFYGSFYNAPTGFWLYRLSDQTLTLLLEHRITDSMIYTVHPGDGTVYFSDYTAHPLYENTFTSSLYRYHPDTRRAREVNGTRMLSSPSISAGSRLVAIRNDGEQSLLVRVRSDGKGYDTLASLPQGDQFDEAAQHPRLPHLGVIARRGTRQSLWITSDGDVSSDLEGPPDLSFQTGSIFDIRWHPVREKLLFSSDFTGRLELYEFDLEKRELIRIARSRFNALEPAYSPDGDRIVYIVEENNRQLPVLLDRSSFLSEPVPETVWNGTLNGWNQPARDKGGRQSGPARPAAAVSEENGWELHSYRPFPSWLKPRMFLPGYRRREEGGAELSLQMLSTDPLGRHTYSIRPSRFHGRYWFDAEYRYSGFYPGFRIRAFSEPSLMPVEGLPSAGGLPSSLLLEQTGASLSIPFQFIFRQNTRTTTLFLEPEVTLSRIRFFGLDEAGAALSSYAPLHSFSTRATFHWRLRQFARDLQPNSGWTLFSQFNLGFADSSLRFQAYGHTITGNFSERRGFRAGVARYLAPLARWNQSLRLRAQFLTQNRPGPYSTRDVLDTVFPVGILFDTNNLMMFDTRYVIPLAWPEDGGVLVPAYLGNLYIALYSQTAADLNTGPLLFPERSRTLIGAGLRARFALSRLYFDFGVGAAWEPARNEWQMIIGSF